MNINNNEENEYRKHGDNTLIIAIGFTILIIIIAITTYNMTINNKCNNYEKETIDKAFNFALTTGLLPTYEGTSYKINLAAVPGWNKEFRGSTCSGSLTIYKTNAGFVKSLDLTNCNKCTTSKKSLSKETDKFNKDKSIVKVDITYNYRNRETNYSEWTDWYDESLISPAINEYNIYMPYDLEKYPKIPETGIVIGYETEKKTVYSYRDQSFKFYKNSNTSYSEFSSTKPVGYTYKDKNTEITTEPSEWSLNYPNEAEYRTIKKTTGYKYYYLDENGSKVYYNNGEYTAEFDNKELEKLYKEKDDDKVNMYSYTDKKWRWYNGVNREYSNYMTEANDNYPYKDDKLTKFSNWSSYKETSSISNDNINYREEKTSTLTRYRTLYAIDSTDILNEYMSLIDFEKATDRALTDMQQDEKINVLIKYSYRYGK